MLELRLWMMQWRFWLLPDEFLCVFLCICLNCTCCGENAKASKGRKSMENSK